MDGWFFSSKVLTKVSLRVMQQFFRSRHVRLPDDSIENLLEFGASSPKKFAFPFGGTPLDELRERPQRRPDASVQCRPALGRKSPWAYGDQKSDFIADEHRQLPRLNEGSFAHRLALSGPLDGVTNWTFGPWGLMSLRPSAMSRN